MNYAPGSPVDPGHCFRLDEGQDDTLRLTWKRDVRITAEMAKQAIAAVDNINGDRRRPLLVRMAHMNALDRAAREHFAEKSSASVMALLGKTPVDRMLAAFALGNSGARAPARYSTGESDAIAWLLTVLPPPSIRSLRARTTRLAGPGRPSADRNPPGGLKVLCEQAHH